MSTTVNILGTTPKQQWLNAIDLYVMVVDSNLDAAAFELDSEGEAYHDLCVAKNALHDLKAEMRRLVDGIME